jgi:predicted transcriptional regulator of viral defense system
MEETGIVIARDHDREALRRALRDKKVEKVRRGAYRSPRGATGDRFKDATDRAIARTVAVSAQLRKAHVSHESAALLHGLRLWQLPGSVHVIQEYRASSASARDIKRHRLVLPEAERTMIDGVAATSLVRTVVDCCISLHPLLALVIVDHALALGMDRDAARRLVAARRDPRGRRRALLVLELGDEGAESAWETWLRYVLLRVGLPRPPRSSRSTHHTASSGPTWAGRSSGCSPSSTGG